jgi:hypothetical protein
MQTLGKVFPCAAFGSMATAHTESLGTVCRSAVELAAGMNRPLRARLTMLYLIRADIQLSYMSGTTPDELGTDGHEHAGRQDCFYRSGRSCRAGAVADRRAVRAGLSNARTKGQRLGRPKRVVDAHRIAALRAQRAGWKKISRIGVGTLYRLAREGCKILEKVFLNPNNYQPIQPMGFD